MLIRLISWLLTVQFRFLAWQWAKFQSLYPDQDIHADISIPIPQASTKELPLELRIAISKLVVARRRGF